MPGLKIAHINIPNNLALAPMAGLTNLPFRLICKELGAGLVYSEMVSAEALVRRNKKTLAMLETDPAEGPLIPQICGGKKEVLRDAAMMLRDLGARAVDLNLGCPVPKIVKSGAGAALARNPALVEEILREMVNACGIPITIKLRRGWDEKSINFPEICRRAQGAGVAAVTLHGRTARQGYGGKADWESIRMAREILSIPLFGNGDVAAPQDAKRMLDATGCDGVMIGRGALGNPWVFGAALEYLRTGELPPSPGPEERVAVMERHLELTVKAFGEALGIRVMRQFWGRYIKGCPGSARLRDRLVRMEEAEEIRRAIREFFQGPYPAVQRP